MSEQLAIKTDDDWTKGKIEKLVRTLAPRESDGGRKSSWAFYSFDEGLPTEFPNPEVAPRILHALFLFVHSELSRKPTDGSRSAVRGVSISRIALTECNVAHEPAPHLIVGYETLHRSLVLDNVERVRLTAQEILEKRASESWRYSRVDMANVLRYLIDVKCIAPNMEAHARSVLAQWDATS